MRYLSAAGVVAAITLLTACNQPTPAGSTAVTFHLNGGSAAAQKVLTKVGDYRAAIVASGADMQTQAELADPNSSSLTVEIPNGAARVLGVRVYYEEKVGGQPSGSAGPPSGGEVFDIPEAIFAGARYFTGDSDPVDLVGEPVDVAVTVSEVQDLVGMKVKVEAVNSEAPATDRFHLLGTRIRATDLETGYVYPEMLFSNGDMAYPPALVPGKAYNLRVDLGNALLEREVVADADPGQPMLLDPFEYLFTPTKVSTASELHDAINAANASPGVDVIDVEQSGAAPTVMLLNAPLPPLNDSFGVVLRSLGDVTIDGSNLSSGTHGLRIPSSRNAVRNLKFANFPGLGMLIDNPSGPAPRLNAIEGCELLNNTQGGLDVRSATFTSIGPNNRIKDNLAFGIRLRGNSTYARIIGNIIEGRLSPPPPGPVHCISLQDDVQIVDVGDFPSGAAAVGLPTANVIGNCGVGVRLVGNVDEVRISANFIGTDPAGGVGGMPNRLGVQQSANGLKISIEGNELRCNGSVSQPGCLPPPSPPLSPAVLEPGGGIYLDSNGGVALIRRNHISDNHRGLVVSNSVSTPQFVEHNSLLRNNIGMDIGPNSTSLEVVNNIIALNSCLSLCTGLNFGTASQFARYDSNLLFNFDGPGPMPPDQDCASMGPYCATSIKVAVNGNISCSSAGFIACDPQFINTTGFPYDIGLQPGSPAVDTGDMQTGTFFGEPFLGNGPDMGAIESH